MHKMGDETASHRTAENGQSPILEERQTLTNSRSQYEPLHSSQEDSIPRINIMITSNLIRCTERFRLSATPFLLTRKEMGERNAYY